MADTNTLTGRLRSELLRHAHPLDPVAFVGKRGRTSELMQHVDTELTQHELIKIKFSDYKDQRREIAREIAEDLEAILVTVVGHVAILYRPSKDPEKRVITVSEEIT